MWYQMLSARLCCACMLTYNYVERSVQQGNLHDVSDCSLEPSVGSFTLEKGK